MSQKVWAGLKSFCLKMVGLDWIGALLVLGFTTCLVVSTLSLSCCGGDFNPFHSSWRCNGAEILVGHADY